MKLIIYRQNTVSILASLKYTSLATAPWGGATLTLLERDGKGEVLTFDTYDDARDASATISQAIKCAIESVRQARTATHNPTHNPPPFSWDSILVQVDIP